MYSKGNMWSSTLTSIQNPTFSRLETESHTGSGANKHAEGQMSWPGRSSLTADACCQEKGMRILGSDRKHGISPVQHQGRIHIIIGGYWSCLAHLHTAQLGLTALAQQERLPWFQRQCAVFSRPL